jgi:uncharacterized metal-binding protein
LFLGFSCFPYTQPHRTPIMKWIIGILTVLIVVIVTFNRLFVTPEKK